MEYFDTAHTTANNDTGTIFGLAAECRNLYDAFYSVRFSISEQYINGTEIDHRELCGNGELGSYMLPNYCSKNTAGFSGCTDLDNLTDQFFNIITNDSEKESKHYSAYSPFGARIFWIAIQGDIPFNDLNTDVIPTNCLNETINSSDDALLDEARKAAFKMREVLYCPHEPIPFPLGGVIALSVLSSSIFLTSTYIIISKILKDKNAYTQV